MSDQDVQTRLSEVERELAVQGREQARQGEQLTTLRSEISGVGSDVKKLLERDARRPDLSLLRVLAVAAGTLTVSFGFWEVGKAVVANAPAVVSLKERMDAADWRSGWATRIDK